MAPAKCCVVGCDSTKHLQKLFCMPKNDHLRNLWMSFLVPTSPYLLGLSENQLMSKRVCQKHFDQTQFDEMGVRIRYSYPCLFTEEEFTHGAPLFFGEYNVLNEHNYFDNRDPEDDTAPGEPTLIKGMADQRLNNPQETMGTTAAVALFFDELFDSVNGSPGQGRGKLRCAVKDNSPHIEFWQSALQKLKTMRYIDTNSKLARRTGNTRLVRVPCLEGWITTLNSFLGLSKLLFSVHKIKYFYPRFINQDPLENFFGRIRAYNYRNVNPNANTFIQTFKSLVISNILTPQSKFANCEEDDGDTLIDYNYLFTKGECDKENVLPNTGPPPSSSSHNVLHEGTTLQKTIAEKVRVQTSAYTAGYMCRKITRKVNCDACAVTYTTKEIDNTHELITHREYKRLKNDTNLTYPNGKILRLYRECAQYVHGYLNKYAHKKDIKNNLKKTIIETCDMSWLGCKNHNDNVKQYFATLIIRLQVHNWCNIINKILNGKIEEKYVLKMASIHEAALKKYKTNKLRQKATKNKD